MNDLLAQQKGLNATQQDSVNIGNMIGKVMNGQVGALSRAGINFTKAQEQILKYGTETEKAATLAEVLEMNVGGVNKALAETDQGKIQNMTNAWSDYKEEIGRRILPLQGKFAGWFAKKIPGIQSIVVRAIDRGVMAFDNVGNKVDFVTAKMKGIKKWGVDAWSNIKGVVDENAGTLEKVTGVLNHMGQGIIGIKDKFVDAFKNEGASWFKDEALPAITQGVLGVLDGATDLYNFVTKNWSKFEPLILGVAGAIATYKVAVITTTAVTKTATIVTNGMALAQGGLNAVMNMSPIGWLALGIGALITVGIALYKNWDTIKYKASELGKGIKDSFAPIGDFFSGLWGGVESGFKGFINFFIDGINTVVSGVNSIKFDVPDWIPKFGGKSFGINIPQIPEFALGTSYFKGGMARINERGGEIVNLPNGSQVIPADKSQQIINRDNSKIEVKVYIQGNVIGNEEYAEYVGNTVVKKVKLALANS
ncbi:hypothetical protein Amet_2425 [Alkaliphilus metalliredigens QYMF]|uniref:Uncharacterized protein n=1 Tax=Alkaliphilus metalliredigens (strain QYMF) TaxID=293826 RepID=A6TQW1_ALKMQ|nr:hypothetical protein [Alkaliphilus metalliredigens]ABR48579.1 hypothetical protein Amet_2425 [Alkaliphilus metalliredigens QYMF]